jgi:S1-C subfamily serine protease
MLRALILGTLVLALPQASGQTPSILHIKMVLLDAEQRPTPVPRHALLISDNPPTAAPRLIVTGLDGTADVRLRPGSYTVESDRPVAFNGKAYQWTQMVQVVAGKDASLDLTAANAEVGDVDAAATPEGATTDTDPSFLLTTWRDSVVAIWTPTTRASGLVIDARGLVGTNQRVIGSATSAEVQLTPEIKVAATVLASDPTRDVAVLWIDPKAIRSVKPLQVPCGEAAKPAIETGQEIYTIGVPLRQAKGMTYGTVTRVEPTGLGSDFRLPRGSAGGPVFAAAGDLIGITSPAQEDEQTSRGDARVVRADSACEVIAAAEKKMKDAAPPGATPLPVEPSRPFPPDALKAAAERRAGSLNPYQIASANFDISFITPVMTFGAQYQAEQGRRRTTSKDTRTANPEPFLVRAAMDFANWSEYVWDFPPVLLIRATPKFEEGFWTKVGRAAAQTQGIAIPAIKRFKSGFSRLRAYCGETEVTPIHPFKLERKVSETDSIYEGLYVFDPGALGPHCASVKLVLFSEKEPDKADAKVVDGKVIEQIWQDFEPYRR